MSSINFSSQNWATSLTTCVAFDSRLSAKQKIAYGIISSMANAYSTCFPSNRYIGKALGVSQRHAERIVSDLCSYGYLTRSFKDKRFLVVNVIRATKDTHPGLDNEINFLMTIPSVILHDTEISDSCKIFSSIIFGLSKKEGYCWASNRKLAEIYDSSIKSVELWISDLKKKNHIRTKNIQGIDGSIEKRFIFPQVNLSHESPNPMLINTLNVSGGVPYEMSGGVPYEMSGHNKIDNTKKNNIKILNVETVSQRSLSDELKTIFDEDIWNRNLTDEGTRGSKKVAFALWRKATKDGKLRDKARIGWEAYVKYQKHNEFRIKRPDFFFNAEKELWLAEWSLPEATSVQCTNEPSNWEYKRAIAIKNKAIPTDERNITEWKYLHRESKIEISKIKDEPKKKTETEITFAWHEWLSVQYDVSVPETIDNLKRTAPSLYGDVIEEQLVRNRAHSGGNKQ